MDRPSLLRHRPNAGCGLRCEKFARTMVKTG